MKQFKTAVREKTESPEGTLTFKIDKDEITAHRPTTAQLAVMIAGFGRHRSEADQIATFIDFFESTLDEKDTHKVIDRLLDRDDDFGLEELAEVGIWMIEEWTGHPIQPPSDSQPSQSTGGRSSKRGTTAKTSSN